MGFEQAWLSYGVLGKESDWRGIERICADPASPVMKNAVSELQKALGTMTGKEPVLCSGTDKEAAGTRCIRFRQDGEGKAERYHVYEESGDVVIAASSDYGMLYGAFELIRQAQIGNSPVGLDIAKDPVMPLRMLNHWDNMDGSIERGYSGNSFFFDHDEILVDDRTVTYARLLASVGINGAVINNVNVKDAATWLITDRYFDKLRQLSEIFAGYGIRLFLSLNYAAPVELGELDSADPLSEEVGKWWKDRMKLVFEQVPHFIELDGAFRDNVILQIKNGPMDFQVREPVHPLFGGLKDTNQMLEVQIAQEYTGQQRHVCYLIPMFQEVLGFRTYVTKTDDTVKDLVSGKTFGHTKCGMAAVANTGNDENWTGHDLAAANLYGFGRLAFDPSALAEEIAREWAVRTFGEDEEVCEVLLFILMNSWRAYEMYNAPLGIGWMVNPNYHYGPSVDGYEYDRWGTYHRADHLGIGVDRSHHGTGYAGLYREPNASMYDSPESCPDELLLFFHHMPYDHKLQSGKTVIQHIYDTHFEGVELVDEMVKRFESLEGKIPDKAYRRMLDRFRHQKEHAREWRDQINTYFYRKSGMDDEKGRQIF